MNANQQNGSSHPVDLLMEEHEVILQVVNAMDRAAADLQAIDEASREFWTTTVDFIVRFVDMRHHGKEEGLLFPALIELGFAKKQGPIAVMEVEHVHGRGLTTRIREATESGDVAELARAAAAYAVLLREHIQKENMILFEMAREALPAEVCASLLDRFPEIDADDDSDTDWFATAKWICDRVGVGFRSPQTGSGCAGATPQAFDV